MTEIILAIEDVPAVMIQLPEELRNGNCGIMFDDGKLVVHDQAVADKIKNAVANLAKGHRSHAKTYAVGVRRRCMSDGIVNVDGNTFSTDERTSIRIGTLLLSAQRDPSKKFYCESLDGPVQLDADGLQAVLDAISAFVDKCFAVEIALHQKIDRDSKVSLADIDAAAWPRG